MCLAVPGKVVAWLKSEGPFARASVEFGGIRREVGMQCVEEAALGDYVLVHAGIAITRVDEEQAERILESIRALELDD